MRLLPVMVLLLAVSDLAADPGRAMPRRCVELTDGMLEPQAADHFWNEAYGRGFRAIEQGDYALAETEMCRALVVAHGFGPRDWRFAETLDELGLIGYQLGDYAFSEAVQGAAVAEMLLAVGPRGEPDPTEGQTRPECRSSVRLYIERLGYLYERRGTPERTAELQREPWRIFEDDYLLRDDRLARRLDWLISRYLLEEDLGAAEALSRLQADWQEQGR